VDYDELARITLEATLTPQRKLRYLLVQGDSKKVMPYIKTESIDQIITSPPYFMQAKYTDTHLEGEIGTRGTLEQYIKDLLEVFIQAYRVLKPTGTFMLNIDPAKREEGFLSLSAWDWIPYLRQIGFKLAGTIIWVDRNRRVIYNPKILDHHFEPVFILAKGRDYTFNWEAVAKLYGGDVWEISGCYLYDRKEEKWEQEKDVWDRSGVATFPVELVTALMTLGSNEGETTLDFFMGSGTVMDVAQRLRRNSIGIEINRDFCGKIMERCFTQNNEYKFITQGELERGKAKL